uniref:Retrovirus-related Pol polyprotein from transposon 17.6 n=1 Tax=Cajanus cajan TaxID=3821 RepID=A0A151TH31_CAJCA|nr:Retrovirus-related Pol polyprotein from transposon 17.6 [Cajanus cajan]
MSAFAWHVKDMPGVDPDFMCHKLAIDPRAKPVIQKRRKIHTPYRMHPADEDKTAFIADQNNYCYKVMPFGLKNAGATYQRLMDKVLVDQLGRNVEAYVDDMVVKSMCLDWHLDDLKELFETIGKYQLKLNPEKCSFGVQAGKFLGFLLTHRGIEENPEKCLAIINMRSPSMVKEPQLAKYLEKVKLLSENFREFILNHVPRDQNSRADLLSKLASTKKPGATRSVIQETLTQPSINETQGSILFVQEELDSWMGSYIAYLTRGELPEDKKEASCLTMPQAQRVMDEIHGGMCGSHIGGRALVYKVARAGYFWLSLRNDCVNWVQKCDGCQRHATLHHSPAERLHSILSPWPFNKWGIDILGPFPIAVRQLKFLIVAVDYFSKWIEAEPVATISAEKVKTFLWKNVVCRYVHSSTQDTPFNLVYGTDAMIPIEIAEPSVRTTAFSKEESDQGRRVDLDLIAETREKARINQVAAHRRAAFKYNTKVVPRDFVVGDLVLKRAQATQMRNKLSPKWVGPYKIDDVVGKGAY